MLWTLDYIIKKAELNLISNPKSIFLNFWMLKIWKVQGVPKKMVFSGKIAIATFKLIQNAKNGGVLQYSGYLLQNGH